jgi:hypothetical protein
VVTFENNNSNTITAQRVRVEVWYDVRNPREELAILMMCARLPPFLTHLAHSGSQCHTAWPVGG